MRSGSVTAALLLATALAVALPAPPASKAEEDPYTLRLNPFKVNLADWHRVGPEKSFQWIEDDAVLVIKGASGKETPSLVYRKRAWAEFEITLRAKKFSSKLRLMLEPEAGGEAVVVEVPRKAVSGDKWCEMALVVGGGRATLMAGGEEMAAAEVPGGTRFRFGFEAPSGASASVTDVRLVRKYVNPDPVCEEGFESLFDGKTLGAWVPMKPEMSSCFSVADGLLQLEVRADDFAGLVLGDRRLKEYELRFRALWGSTGLVLRAVEVPGLGGVISRTSSAQLDLTPQLDPDDSVDFVVRVKDRRCTLVANGKQMVDDPVGEYVDTPLLFIVTKGKKALIRDLRIRDLSGEAAGGNDKGE